ncbi:c-type cytochrome [Aliiruegeria lutimaris]|uniref:Cytochrome c556 n=1 Tax=Aliiruegeria lutimaris TaxID=571298 RepID=A0A1G8YJ52_9RHOB|nr:cytochrome c [Aliiruegeria lutimaris]SDK02733.1 Cytochrome c556 [Aliiruegeria lutimaris]
MRLASILVCCGLAATVAGTALAQDKPNPAISARKNIMQLYAFNLGQLGAMAKEAVAYDAEAASSAAGNLALLTQLDHSALWPQGTDNAADPNTRALPELWANFDDVVAKATALSEAATAMEAAAGTDLASLQAAMGGLGAACGACHKAYRAAEN